jgi:hypothetical protein
LTSKRRTENGCGATFLAWPIRINAIQMGTDQDADQGDMVTPVMQDYANSSCGWYTNVTDYSDNVGVENAILYMLYNPDECDQ